MVTISTVMSTITESARNHAGSRRRQASQRRSSVNAV